MKRLRILVVDDNPRHRQAAVDQLDKDHDLTVLDSYYEAIRLLRNKHFDVLLSDLLMPAEAETLGPTGMQYLGHEMAAGMFLAFAASRYGVRHVAVITDTNHHNHPVSAIIDRIENNSYKVNETTTLIMHAPLCDEGKDWKQTLNVLMSF